MLLHVGGDLLSLQYLGGVVGHLGLLGRGVELDNLQLGIEAGDALLARQLLPDDGEL